MRQFEKNPRNRLSFLFDPRFLQAFQVRVLRASFHHQTVSVQTHHEQTRSRIRAPSSRPRVRALRERIQVQEESQGTSVLPRRKHGQQTAVRNMSQGNACLFLTLIPF